MRGYQIDLRHLRKEARQHRSGLFVVGMIALATMSLSLAMVRSSSAEGDTLHPVMCSGDWLSPERVVGTPLEEGFGTGFFERAESSARPSGDGSRIFCSFLPAGELEREIERVTLTFHFARGVFGTPELIETVPPETEATDATPVAAIATDSTDPSALPEMPETPAEPEATSTDALDARTEGVTPAGGESPSSDESVHSGEDPLPEASLLRYLLGIAHAQESETATVSATSWSFVQPESTEVSSSTLEELFLGESASTTDALVSTTTEDASVPQRNGVLRFSYTLDGEIWRDLGAVDTVGDEVAFELPIAEVAELQTLVVRVVNEGVFHEPVYLEGITLSVEYPEAQGESSAPEPLVAISAERIGMPDLDQFTIARIVAFDSTIAAVLTNPSMRALFVFDEGVFDTARIVAHVNDMQLETPIAAKDGRVYWLGRGNDVVAYDPVRDAYFREMLIQGTSTPGALEAKFAGVTHTVVLHDGRMSFRDDGGTSVQGDDAQDARDTFLREYFDSAHARVTIQSQASASILSVAPLVADESTSTPEQEAETSLVEDVFDVIERLFTRALVSDTEAQQRCISDPFSHDLSEMSESSGLITMTLEAEKGYRLEAGDLPYGLTLAFDGQPMFEILPGRTESVPFTIRAAPDARKGNFTIPLFLTTRDKPHVSTVCKLNITTI